MIEAMSEMSWIRGVVVWLEDRFYLSQVMTIAVIDGEAGLAAIRFHEVGFDPFGPGAARYPAEHAAQQPQ